VSNVSFNEFGNALYSRTFHAAAEALNYLTQATPVPYMTSVNTFIDGGIGVNGDDKSGGTATWFLAPYTSPDKSESMLGLYYKGSGVTPVLVHRFVVDIPKLDTIGVTPPQTVNGGVFKYDGNQGPYNADGYENPPHLKPVWTLTDGGLGISSSSQPDDTQWFLAPYWNEGGDRSSLGVYYRAANSTYHLVHDFVLDVAAIK
jgi:hypothetical protein